MIASVKNIALALAAVQGAVAAEHHAHKRDDVYVTVQTTLYVTAGHEQVVPTTTAAVVDSTKETSSASAEEEATSTYSATATSSAQVLLESTSASTGTSTASTSGSSSSASASVGSAGALGITYSPYNSDGSCKSTSEVAEDVAKLSGYDIIRLYGVDCNQVANVNAAKASGQKLFLGIYYMSAIADAVSTMDSALDSNWDDVYTVAVGNELVNNGEATVSQVAGYMTTARTALTAAGYTGPVVSTDTWIAVIKNPGLCDLSDYMAVNAHAYFDGAIAAADAGSWLLEQIQRTYTACGGAKSILITESGWPTQGNTNGVAIPSEKNQAAAIASIKEYCANDVILFTAFNDLWKSAGSYGVEQYWGLYSS